MDIVVGLDFGTSRIKAGAFDRKGRALGCVAVDTPVFASEHGGTEFPVLRMLEVARGAIARLSGTGPIAALGISSMGEVGTVLGSQLAPVCFPAWYDQRGSDIVSRLESRLPRAWLTAKTGGHARTTSSLAKLGWLRENGFDVAGTFLGLAGALAWELTGEAWNECSLAATTGAFDPVTRQYVRDIWSAAGLAPITLPPVHTAEHGEPARGPAAIDLGLQPDAPVVIAGHDHLVAAMGCGAVTGDVVDSMGTGEPVLAVAEAARVSSSEQVGHLVAAGLTVECWPPTGQPLLAFEGLRPGLAMSTMLAASGRSWLEAEQSPKSPPVALAEPLIAALEGGDVSLVQAAIRDAGVSWPAIFEHYAQAAHLANLQVRRGAGASGPTLITGGGIRSGRWLRAKAQLLEEDAFVVDVQESGVRGAAAAAGTVAGWWPSSTDMPGVVRVALRQFVARSDISGQD